MPAPSNTTKKLVEANTVSANAATASTASGTSVTNERLRRTRALAISAPTAAFRP